MSSVWYIRQSTDASHICPQALLSPSQLLNAQKYQIIVCSSWDRANFFFQAVSWYTCWQIKLDQIVAGSTKRGKLWSDADDYYTVFCTVNCLLRNKISAISGYLKFSELQSVDIVCQVSKSFYKRTQSASDLNSLYKRVYFQKMWIRIKARVGHWFFYYSSRLGFGYQHCSFKLVVLFCSYVILSRCQWLWSSVKAFWSLTYCVWTPQNLDSVYGVVQISTD